MRCDKWQVVFTRAIGGEDNEMLWSLQPVIVIAGQGLVDVPELVAARKYWIWLALETNQRTPYPEGLCGSPAI